MLAFALIPFFILGAAAIQVTAPSNSSGWTSQGAQLIQWNSVNTDPSNFTIELISPSSANSPKVIGENIKTSQGSFTYTPSSDLAVGPQWRVNLVQTGGQAILAQSEYFQVEQGVSSISASSSSSSSASGPTSSSASASSTQTNQPSSASNAPTTSSSAAADPTMQISVMGLVAMSFLTYLF